jgi:hypothetical protein
MSCLHRIRVSVEGVARHFGAEAPQRLIAPSETIGGYPDLVVLARAGGRHLRAFSWGLPCHRLVTAFDQPERPESKRPEYG